MENRNRSLLREDYNEADQVLEVDADHTKWWNTVDEYLSNDEGTRNSIMKAHQVTLIVSRFESVLALHRSVLATSKKNSAYNAALQRCISASRSIINTLHKALRGFGAFDGSPGQRGYDRTPLVWPSFTWAVWMSTFIIVFAATEGQVSRENALRLADRSTEILRHLALRGTNWPEACIIAIQNLVARLREASTRSSTVAPGVTSGPREPSASSAVIGHQQHVRHNDSTNLRHMGLRRSGTATPGTAAVMPAARSSGSNNHSLYPPMSYTGGIDAFNMSGAAMQNTTILDTMNPASAYLAGAGNFLGIAQQSSDNPIPNDEIMHLFNGEDMAHWLGADVGFGGSMTYQDDNFQ